MKKRNILKKTCAIGISAAMIISMMPGMAFAADDGISFEAEIESTGNLTMAAGVTEEMCQPSYWNDKALGDIDKILMTHEEIDDWNLAVQKASGTSICDIAGAYKEVYNADSIRESLSNPSQIKDFLNRSSTIYIGGVPEDTEKYLTDVLKQVSDTGYTETSKNREYAIGVHRSALKSFPILKEMGWSAADCDDENQFASIDVNEPLVIGGRAEVNNHLFYYVFSDNCSGWVDGDHIAVCKDKEEWLSAWKVDSSAKDFLVVTSNKIIMEKSHMNPELSEVKLSLGTVLKLVPEAELSMVGERGTWNNYVVYLPTRNAEGMYKPKKALISQHYDVSIGYPEYTQANVLKIAFGCLGDRYGWGGSDEAMDCSLYARLVYKCLGFQMPRNTTWQCNVPAGIIDMTGMSESDKGKLLSTSPAGTLMYFSGLAHGMIYVGTDNNTGYLISNTGTLYDTDGKYYQEYNIILNPVTVKRGNGYTWLANSSMIMLPAGPADIKDAKVKLTDDDISVTYEGSVLYKGINYEIIDNGDTFTVNGINNFKGSKTVSKNEIDNADISLSNYEYTYSGNRKNPIVTVSINGTKLEKNTDYTVSYSNNINAGTAEVTVTGKGSYSGTLTETFNIIPADISTVTMGKTSFSYADSIKDLGLTNSKGNSLVKDKDYTVDGIESLSPAGDYDITITGSGNYTGTMETEITVTPAELSKIGLSYKTLYYTGKSRIPSVTVYADGFKCSDKMDALNISKPKNPVLPGTYKITAKGKNNLTGSLSASYKISIKPTSITSKTALKKGFKVTAGKVSSTNVRGYQVRYSTYSSMKNAKKTACSTNNIRTVKNLKSKKTYYVQVRTYKTIDGKKYYSAWSAKKSIKTK